MAPANAPPGWAGAVNASELMFHFLKKSEEGVIVLLRLRWHGSLSVVCSSCGVLVFKKQYRSEALDSRLGLAISGN